MTRSILSASAGAALLAALGAPVAFAQNPLQNGRMVVASPTVLGMGDAGVAFSTRDANFFYNPAHVVRTTRFLPQFAVGVQARASANLQDKYKFYDEEIAPAVDRGIDNLTPAERDTLYDRSLRLLQDRSYVTAEVPATFAMRVGPVAIGAGVFFQTGGRLRATPGGGGVPTIEAALTKEVAGVASVGLDLGAVGMRGLAVGANARVLRRSLSVKEKPLDAFEENEQPYLYQGTGFSVDVGALYDVPVPLPGTLTLGAAALDVVGQDADLAYDGRYYCANATLFCDTDASEAPSPSLLAQEEALAEARFAVKPSYRVGVAYTAPQLFGLLTETGVAVDYLGYSKPQLPNQPRLAHLNVGAQATLLRMVALRVGLNQGYFTGGAGLKLGPLALDYTYYGFEEGVNPGDTPAYQHLAAVRFVF